MRALELDLRPRGASATDEVCPACNGTGSITGVEIEIRGSQRIHPPRCPECCGVLARNDKASQTFLGPMDVADKTAEPGKKSATSQ
jgi:hypothetical protein